MNSNPESTERRSRERKLLTAPIRVRFRLDMEGEISDISSDGMAIRFSPGGQPQLMSGNNLTVHLDMNGKTVSLDGVIRQVSETDGDITVGLNYDRALLAVISSRMDQK
ncbi:PilZ domain-containing protein [bacterium]|nr:PilZ domain-containing protein [candidate division CSSED10-310 bacterium]